MIDKIERLREGMGLTQDALEAMAELSRKRLSKLGRSGRLSASEALRTARVLMVPLDWLCDDEAPDEPPPLTMPVAEWERYVLEAIRSAGLSYSDVMAKLMGPTPPGDKMTGLFAETMPAISGPHSAKERKAAK